MPPRHHHHQAAAAASALLGAGAGAGKETNDLRQKFDEFKKQHEQFDSKEEERRKKMRAEKEERIQKMRREAAQNLGMSEDAVRDRNSPKSFFYYASLTIVVAVIIGTVMMLIQRQNNFFVSDAICKFRRAAGLVSSDAKQLAKSTQAAMDRSRYATVHSSEHNRTFFWGTYRPNVLAGVKSRETEPLLFGIAWFDGNRMLPVRHTAEDGEEVFFRWDVHDGRWYGRELVEDRQLGMRLRIRFAKSPTRDGWLVNIEGQRVTFQPVAINFAVYFASEYSGSQLHVRSRYFDVSTAAPMGLQEGAFSKDNKLIVSGKLQTNNKAFLATVTDLGAPAPTSSASSASPTSDAQWQVFTLRNSKRKEAWNIDFKNGLRGGARVQEHHHKPFRNDKITSIVMMKRFNMYVNDFRFDIALSEQGATTFSSPSSSPSSSPEKNNNNNNNNNNNEALQTHFQKQYDTLFRTYSHDPCSNEYLFNELENNFKERFESIFDMSDHYSKLTEMFPSTSFGPSKAKFLEMTQSGLSNLLGGLGFWHGDYRVQTKAGNPRHGAPPTIETHGPRTLFSGVPSRAKFPRGFLWDEGFHQLLVHHWDRALSEDVLLHWLSLMEPNGWIPREQILGPEARTRVPNEFVAQHPEHTNPPAMLLVLQGMLLDERKASSSSFSSSSSGGRNENENDGGEDRNGGDDEDGSNLEAFSTKAAPLLSKWFRFLVDSQCGGNPKTCGKLLSSTTTNAKQEDIEKNNATFLFRWRSRNGYHLLASGLDDYPRPHCAPQDELHLDLYCWIHMVSRSIRSLQTRLHLPPATISDSSNNDLLLLPHLVASDESWKKWLINVHWDHERKQFSDVTGCDDGKKKAGVKGRFSPHFGFVNLWPLLTLSLDEKERDYVIEIIEKAKTELSGGKGLQSLSNRSRRLLRQGEHDDYWTGPIWININFLFLRALHRKYIAIAGPRAVEVYNEVRRDVLSNVARVFGDTGKLWENYDISTGNGRGTAPFTGWTTLVILIAAERY